MINLLINLNKLRKWEIKDGSQPYLMTMHHYVHFKSKVELIEIISYENAPKYYPKQWETSHLRNEYSEKQFRDTFGNKMAVVLW